MRPVWTGSISFGLVNVPVRLLTATSGHDLSLHQIHDEDHGRIRYERRCEVCGQAIDFQHIDKAFEEAGRTVVLTDEELASLPAERSREIEVVEFVPAVEVDPIRFDRAYYVEPATASAKAYVLLREVLSRTERVAIARVALRRRSSLAALRVYRNVITLQTLLWDDEVRQPAVDFDDDVHLTEQELSMSAQLVEAMAAPFIPGRFTDEYQQQLRGLIEAKLEGGHSVTTASTLGEGVEARGEVVDLMEALRRSLERSAQSAGPAPETGEAKRPKAASRRGRTPKTG